MRVVLSIVFLIATSCNFDTGSSSSIGDRSADSFAGLKDNKFTDKTPGELNPDGSISLINGMIIEPIPGSGGRANLLNPDGSLYATIDEGEFVEIPREFARVNADGVIALGDNTLLPPIIMEASRPSGDISILREDLCICVNNKSETLDEQCNNYCQNEVFTSDPTLFLKSRPGPLVESNNQFNTNNSGETGTLAGWCRNQITEEEVNPSCVLETVDRNGRVSRRDLEHISDNDVMVPLFNVPLGEDFLIRLKEIRSGAVSKSMQIRRVPSDGGVDDFGPLLIRPVNQYTCINFAVDGSNNFEAMAKQYFYYRHDDSDHPDPLNTSIDPNIDSFHITCKDNVRYPGTDRSNYPRLELIEDHIRFWDFRNDFRLITNENDPIPEVHRMIQQKLRTDFQVNLPSPPDYFALLPFPRQPIAREDESNLTTLGYYLKAFEDRTQLPRIRRYCPTQVHFNSDIPELAVLKYIIGFDTEPFYLFQREVEEFTNSLGQTVQLPDAAILVTQSLLLRYGWHDVNGVMTRVTSSSISERQVFINWPVCQTQDCDPTLRGPGQFQFFKRDQAIGCVPKRN